MVREDGHQVSGVFVGRISILTMPFLFRRSCCKLSYQHAQEMLDYPTREFSPSDLPPVSAPWSAYDLSRRVNALQRVALQLRRRRVENGALRLDQPKLAFGIDKETGMPHVREESFQEILCINLHTL